MPFTIVRNDITRMQVDAIVNTANPNPLVGAGTDFAIHQAAGPKLLQARQKIGAIAPGNAAITRAYELNAKYVIHTVGPVWAGGTANEKQHLTSCYENSLALALQKRCKSIAFPLIASGNYGFPRDLALQIAIDAFTHFLQSQDMDIYLVVYDQASYKLSESRFQNVASYIDEQLVVPMSAHRYMRRDTDCMPPPQCYAPAPCKSMSLEDMLRQEDAGFTQTLLDLIDKTGQKDSQIYKRANLSKQHFSKIRNDPHYRPKKATALALALALELDLEQTKDLIGRAGYALTNSSKFDLIVRFFIEQGNYNVIEISMALYEFDQPLLGA